MNVRVGHLSIRDKLFFSFFALILFFLALYLAVNAVVVTRENKSQVLRTAEHVFAQETANLEYRTEAARNLLYELTTNSTLQDLFGRSVEYYKADIGRWPIDYQAFQKLSYLTSFNPGVTAVRLIMKRGLASIYENDNIVSMTRVQDKPWFKRFLADDRRLFWHFGPAGSAGADGPQVHADLSVFDPENMNELVGVVELDISRSAVEKTLADALLSESTISFLVDGHGDVVETEGTGADTAAEGIWKRLSEQHPNEFTDDAWQTVHSRNREYLVGAKSISNSDWTLVLSVPYSDVEQLSSRPAQLMLLVFLLMTPLPPLLAFFVSRSATKRIRNLIINMDRVVQGDFSETLDPGSPDELGRLTERFNFMTREIEQLLDDKYELGQEVKSLELKALQAQINPHFLYNTLDLINWMAVRRNAKEIEELVNALSTFYKLSLSRGEDTVTLREELEHARTYVYIQNMRYDNAVDFSVEVPDELLSLPVLKLVVQPLVENAIFHGIMMKPEERGAIRISAGLEGNDLLIRVSDDGVGMTAEQLRTIRDGTLRARDFHGYGVKNIHNRLELRYGPGYGLRFVSSPENGTAAVICIPASAKDTTRGERGGVTRVSHRVPHHEPPVESS